MAVTYLNPGDSITADRWNSLFEELDNKLNIALDDHSMCFWYSQTGGRYFQQFFGQCFFFHDPDPHFSDEIFEGFKGDYSDFPLVDTASPGLVVDYVNYTHTPFVAAAAATAKDTAFTPSQDDTRRIVRIQQVADTYYEQIGRNPDIKFSNVGLFHWSLEAITKPITLGNGQTLPYRVFVRNDPSPELIYKYANVELIYEGASYQNVIFPRNYNKFNFFRIHNLNSTEMNFTFKGSSNQDVFSLTIPAYGSKCVRRDSVNSGYLEGFSHFHRFKSGDYRFYCAPLNLAPNGFGSGWKNVIGLKRGATKSNNVVNPQLAFVLIRKMELGGPAQWYLDPTRFWDASSIYSPDYFASITDETILGDLLHHKGTLGLQKISPSEKTLINYRGYANLVEDFSNAGFTVTPGTNEVTLAKTGEHDFLSVSTNLISARYGTPGKTFTDSITLNCTDDQSLKALSALPLDLAEDEEEFRYTTFTTSTDENGNITVVAGSEVQSDFPVNRITDVSADTGQSGEVPIHTTNLETLETLQHFGASAFNPTNQDTDYTTQDEREVTLTGFGAILTWTKRVSTEHPITPNREFQSGLSDSNRILHAGGTINGLIEFDGTNFIRKKFVHFSGYGWPTWYPGTDTPGGANEAPDIHGAFNSPRKIPRFGRFRFVTFAANENIYHPSGGRAPIHPDFSHTWDKQTADDSTLKDKLAARLNKTRIGVLSEFSLLNVYTLISAWARGVDLTIATNPITSLPHQYKFASGSYSTYRSEITSNTPSNLNFLDGPLVFDRLPLLVDHYNNLASAVNAIHKIQPLHFASFYDNAVANTEGIFGTDIRPANQYAAYELTSHPGYQTLIDHGVTLKSTANFPASYNQLLTAKYRKVTVNDSTGAVTFSTTADPLLNSTWKTILFGNPNATQGDYHWFTIEDVKSKAAELGFNFYFQSAVVPLKLTITDGTALSTLYDKSGGIPFNNENPARFPAFVSCESESEIEWVKPIDVSRVREDYEPADVFTFKTFNGDVHEVVTDSRWLKRNWNLSGNIYATQPLYDFDKSYHSFLFINHLPDGETSTSKVIANSAPYIDFGENFSQQSAGNAVARQTTGLGLAAIPGTIQNTEGGRFVLSMAAGDNFITAADTTFPAAELTFFVDTLIDA